MSSTRTCPPATCHDRLQIVREPSAYFREPFCGATAKIRLCLCVHHGIGGPRTYAMRAAFVEGTTAASWRGLKQPERHPVSRNRPQRTAKPDIAPHRARLLYARSRAALSAGAARPRASSPKACGRPTSPNSIELSRPDQRVDLIQAFGADFDFEVFSELDETVRDQLSEALPNELLARAVTELDTDDAAYIIEDLEESDREEIFAQISLRATAPRSSATSNTRKRPPAASCRRDFVAVAPFWTVGQVIDYMREADDLPDTLLGDLRRRSRASACSAASSSRASCAPSATCRSKRHGDRPARSCCATEDQEEVARQFERYDL